MALVLSNLGILAAQRDADDEARVFYEESLQLRRQLADRQGEAISLQNLADLAIKRGDLARARNLLQESLALYRESKNDRGLAYAFEGLASLALASGEVERAARLFGAAEGIRQATGVALSRPNGTSTSGRSLRQPGRSARATHRRSRRGAQWTRTRPLTTLWIRTLASTTRCRLQSLLERSSRNHRPKEKPHEATA
jgi:tetratricopeptide (TPR) repeat protein